MSDEFTVLLFGGPFDHKIVKCGGSEVIRVPIPETNTVAIYEWSAFDYAINWETGEQQPTNRAVGKYKGTFARDATLGEKFLATVHE